MDEQLIAKQIRELAFKYKNDIEIGDFLGLPVSMVKTFRRDHNIPSGIALRSQCRQETIMANIDKPIDDIVKLTGMTRSGLKNMMERMRMRGQIDFSNEIFFEGKYGDVARKVSIARQKQKVQDKPYSYWEKITGHLSKELKNFCNQARKERIGMSV